MNSIQLFTQSFDPSNPMTLSNQTYTFQNRTVRVVGSPENPLFVAADVCAVLGISNNRDAIEKLDADEKADVALTDTPGGKQAMAVVTEFGLYTLILRCRKATTPGTTAHAFRKWLTSEVLPSIRKTGGYQQPSSSALDQLELMIKAAREQERCLNDHEQRLNRVEVQAVSSPSHSGSNAKFLAVREYAKIHGIRLSRYQTANLGQKATNICRNNGIKVCQSKGKKPCLVNSYPVEVLDEVFDTTFQKGGAQ